MADSPYHATFLATLNRRLGAGGPPDLLMRIIRQTAREFGYIMINQATFAPGLGVSIPFLGGASINAPFVIDVDTGLPQANQFGLTFSTSTSENLFNFSITTSITDYESLDRVSDPNIGALQNGLSGLFSGQLTRAYENSDRIAIQLGQNLGVGVRDPNRTFNAGVDLLFADMTVSLWKADSYFTSVVRPAIFDAIDDLNSANAGGTPTNPTFLFDAEAVASAVRGRISDANFAANWRNLALVEIFNARAPGSDMISGNLPLALGGGPGTGAGSVYFELGNRTSGDLYLKVRNNGLLGSHATTITVSETYIGLNRDGTASTAPARLQYTMLTTGSGGIEPDPTRGVTVGSGADGLTGPGSELAGQFRFENVELLNGFLDTFDKTFKGQCFAAGTPILMADGTEKPVEDIRVGDLVASFDPREALGRGPLSPKKVAKLFKGTSAENIKIGDITVTAGHPYLAEDGNFYPGAQLQGRRLVDQDGELRSISAESIATDEIEVFNFEVEDFHTYIAGGSRVHNLSLKLNGTDGYIGFTPNGDALGILFDGKLGIRIVDWARSANVARLLSFDPGKFSERVWNDLASPNDTASDRDLRAFNEAVEGGIPRNEQTISTVFKYYLSDKEKLQEINSAGAFGAAIGGALGAHLFSGSTAGRLAGSTVFAVIGENLAEFMKNGGDFNLGLDLDETQTIFSDLGEEIVSAGVGAVSSYLVAELLRVTGIDGFAGEFISSAAGSALGKIVTNITLGRNALDGLSGAHFANLAGSFLGTKLASSVVSFDSIGGQLGSSIGSSLGSIIAGTAINGTIGGLVGGLGITGLASTLLAGFLTAGIGAFIGFIAGGLIGSVFGGTPRSGADAAWDEAKGEFVVSNLYARKGGSKEAAKAMASAVAATLNGVIDASGGVLQNPTAVQSGNYGMRKDDFVYRPVHTKDKDAITFRVSSKKEDGLAQIVNHGLYNALTDGDFKIAGGNVYVKRGIYNSLGSDALTRSNFDPSVLMGNIHSALAYADYVENRAFVQAIAADNPDTVFMAELAITLARASELGLTRRHASDWYGGFSFVLGASGGTAADVAFAFELDPSSGHIGRLLGIGSQVLQDTIDVAGQTLVEGSTGDDIIRLVGTQLVNSADGLNENLNVDEKPYDGFARQIEVAARINAGEGNDIVHASDRGDNVFGGAGTDIIYGGRLDDWLLGGVGDDVLDAGAEAGGLAGDGNYLHGGAGNDLLRGREGSDWLEGGEGVDRLTGGAGGDVLAGGAGNADDLEGGAGDDIYLVRRGDGADAAEDASNAAPVASPTRAGDAVSQRYEDIRLGRVLRDWLGRSSGVSNGKIEGGEDAIHFGIGIGLGDVQLARSASGRDLIVQLKEIDLVTGAERLTGDVLTITDWFADSFKRVEWLKFADGTEVRIGDVTSFIVGTGGDDVLIGTNGRDFVHGGGGNDELYLLAGDDIGSGGSGDDLVSGGADHDLVVGGLGIDKLIGGSGNDALSGDASADDLYGGQGNDVLSGGRDDGDVLAGGAGDDRFKFSRGDGHDIVFDDYSDHWVSIWQGGQWINGYQYNASTSEVIAPDGSYVRKNFGSVEEPDLRWVGRFDYDDETGQLRHFVPPAGAATTVSNKGVDTIEFALDINIQDIILTRPAGTDDIRLTVSRESSDEPAAAAADSITLKDYYDAPGAIEKLAFYQTGEIDISATGYRLVAGTDGADGTEAAPLTGGAGRDWVTGAGGDDFIAGGASDDIVAGNGGSDYLKGEGGNDVLYGGAGNDILDGGAGADILSGGGGMDTASYASTTTGVTVFLTETSMNTGDAVGDVYEGISNLTGGGGTDTFGGDFGDNELAGGKGTDLLLGSTGSDTYIWNIGDGTDTIHDVAFTARTVVGSGGELLDGYDVQWTQGEWRSGSGDKAKYYWKLQVTAPDGVMVYSYDYFTPKGDVPAVPAVSTWPSSGWMDGLTSSGKSVGGIAYDASVNAGEADAIELGAGISLSDLVFEREGEDLVISYVEVDDGNEGAGNAIGVSNKSSLHVRGHFTENGRIESLIFADGLSITLNSILAATTSDLLLGTAGDDLIGGQRGVRIDNLDGGAGNDVLAGGEGDDVLSGSAGDDILEGGAGADTLDGGDHTPYVPPAERPAEAVDALVRRGDHARYVTSLAAVSIDLASGAAQSGGDAQGDILLNIENVTGSAHSDTISGNAEANQLRGLAGDDIMAGREGDDVLVGDAGNDTLSGDAGDDNFSGGDGNDILAGGAGNDIMAGDSGDDQVSGGDGNDMLTGDVGTDRLDGGTGDDILVAGDGGDTLIGGDGKDQLTGGGGNDRLEGGAGDDTYSFAAGFGQDVLFDSDGKNEIVINSSVSHDQLWLEQKGNDLVISVRGSADQLTVTGFFLGTQPSRAYSIQTATHRLFIGHPDVRNFIAAMTAASASGIPESIPANIAALMPRYWHPGTKATPYAENFALSIDEDSSTGTIQVGAVDHDENISGYRIGTAPANGQATIDQSGNFAYLPGVHFNGTDSFTVIISDADQLAREITVNVAIAPVDDAPVIDPATLAIDEQASRSATQTGDLVATLVAHEFDGEAIVFSLIDDAGGRFAISAGGRLSIRDADRLDHEAAAEHGVTVRVTDAVGSFTERRFSIAINDINEANSLPAAYAWNVNENSAAGTLVGRVLAADLDHADAAYGEQRYAFWRDGAAHQVSFDGRYRIDALTGEIKVAGTVNHEAPSPVAQYEVIARDNRGATGFFESRTSVTIAITDLNEANSIQPAHDFTFFENETAGLQVGAVAASDPDNPGTAFASQRYFFWHEGAVSAVSSDGRFTIDELTGAIFANASFDYESDVQDATYQVVARDNAGAVPFFAAVTDVALHIANVNEAPETPVLTEAAGLIAEGAAAGALVARFALADPDRTVPTLVPETNPGGLFAINGGDLVLAAVLDFETLVALGFTVGDADLDGRHDVTVSLDLHASDGELRSAGSVGASVILEDVNEAPTSLDFQAALAAIDERDRLAPGSVRPAVTIGALSVQDPDTAGFANASYTYTVNDPRFEMIGNQLRLREGVSLDFEQEEQLSLTVTATDSGVDPFSITRTLTFAVADHDDILDGTQDIDLLEGQKGRDIIRGLAGDDELRGHLGNDDLDGGDGADLLLGGEGLDYLQGGSNNDRIEGEAGDDRLDGGSGNDTLLGGAGSDTIAGSEGDDRIIVDEDGGLVIDSIDGGADVDVLSYSHFGAGVDADLAAALVVGDRVTAVENIEGSLHADSLAGNEESNSLIGLDGDDVLVGRGGNDILAGGIGNDELAGGAGDDGLDGGSGADLLSGGDGNDVLLGGAGADILLGDANDDYIEGGAGNDTADGGAGDDSYIIDRRSHHDTIYNYDATGDDIDVLGFKDTYGVIEERDLWFERQGDDLLVTVIGADASVLVKNFYLAADPVSRANHQIDFFIAGERYTRDTDVEALVNFMAGFAKPADEAELDLLLADPDYEVRVATYFGINAPPTINGLVDQRFDEGGSVVLTLSVADDITPEAGIKVTHEVLSGGELFNEGALELGPVGSDGRLTLRLAPGTYRAGTAVIALTAEDAGGISVTQQIQLTVDPVATTPIVSQFLGGAGTSGGAGVALSLSVEFPDRDGSELHEVMIAGVPAGVALSRGSFDAASGLWRLTPGELSGLAVLAPAGWSQDLALTVTARASEGGLSAAATATTTVILNAPPTGAALSGSIAENAPYGTLVGTISGIDPDAGDDLTLELLDNADGRFSLDVNGALTVLDTAKLDFEVGAAHNIRVKVIDSFGQAVERTLTVQVNNVNEANSIAPTHGFSLDENLAGGTLIGQVQAGDLDSAGHPFAEQRYYFRTANGVSDVSADGLFRIDMLTGRISTTRALDYESDAPGTYAVVARDNRGQAGYNQAESQVSVGLRNLNEANGLPASINLSVAENQGIGALVGTIDATDFDSAAHPFGEQRYYFLVGNEVSGSSADGRFTIDATSGEIRTTRALDRESADASTAHVVVARDNRGTAPFNQATAGLSITTANVNETPNAPTGIASAVFDESGVGSNPAAGGIVVASYGLSDPDGNVPALAFAASGNPNGWFAISGNSVRFAAGFSMSFAAARDWAASQGYSVDANGRVKIGTVVVQASDGSLLSGTKTTDVYIQDVAQAPNVPVLAAQTLHSETLPGGSAHGGQVIASFSLSDPDGPIPALAITGGDANNWFTTVGGSLVFRGGVNFTADWLRANRGLHGMDANFSSDIDGDGLKEIRVASLTLAAVDGNGLISGGRAYDVLIEEKNEAPVWNAPSFVFSLAEDAAAYTAIGRVGGTDIDDPASALRYRFEGASVYRDGTLGRDVSSSGDGRVLMDVATGDLFVKPGADFNADGGQTSFNYAIQLTDRSGGAHAISRASQLSLSVTSVNDPHTLVDSSGAINEVDNLGPLVPLFDLSQLMLSDPEGRNMQWTFEGGGSTNGIWTLTSDGKIVLTNGGVDYEELTTVTTSEEVWNGYDYVTTYRTYRDHSRATSGLRVVATDASTGLAKTATFTATVNDVNEGPTYTGVTTFIIKDDKGEGEFGEVFGRDPETGSTSGITYRIDAASVQKEEINLSPGGSGDVDNSGHPTVSLRDGNDLRFDVPNDGEWEGGIKDHPTLGGRWYFQLNYSFDLVMTDASGVQSRQKIMVKFLKHGTSHVAPVVFDLDGDGLELVAPLISTIWFDADGDGLTDRTGWVKADDGLLVLDRNGNGTIDNGLEISFMSDVAGATSDLEGLRFYDSNADGRLDAGDARFAEFRVWRDLNQDGISQAGELLGLIDAGINAISLSATLTGESTPSDDNVVFATATFERVGGGTGAAGDVFLTYQRTEPAIAAPVILDYDGDGTSLVSLADSATRFDMDGDGTAERTGWFEAGDAMLALDRNGDGAITQIGEISFVGDKEGAKTDLEGLVAFDTNANQILDAGDKRFAAFRLWFDTNSNGVSDAGELKSLVEAGVAAISLKSTKEEGDGKELGGNIIYGRGAFAFDDGRVGGVLDVGLAYLPEDGSSAPVIADGTAEAQPGETNAAKTLEFARRSFERKAKKFMVSSLNGELVVNLRKAGTVDPRAGAVSGATIMRFSNMTVGMLSPIILDLDGDGLDLQSRKKSKARFDMDGNGRRDDSGWVGKGDGFLVIDRNNDGVVNDGSELSFLTEDKAARSDLQALASLDSNRDGAISSADKRFGELKVWVDRNRNGITEAGELQTLAEHGIASVSLAGRAVDAQAKVGSNVVLATSTFTRTDGSVGTVGDVALAFKPAPQASLLRSALGGLFDLKEEGLPAGYPTLRSLRAGLVGAAERQIAIDPLLLRDDVDAFARYGSDAEAHTAPAGAENGSAGVISAELAAAMAGYVGSENATDAARLALMTQDMAVFGALRGEGLLERRDRAMSAPLDYFAA